MFKEVIICEIKNKATKVHITDLSNYEDTLKQFKYPCELVGGLNQQVKPYFDVDFESYDKNYDEDALILKNKTIIQSLFNLDSLDDIYVTKRPPRTKKDKIKYSHHYTLDNIRISNFNIQKLLIQNNITEFDTSVYDTNRGMCSLYTTKKPNCI